MKNLSLKPAPQGKYLVIRLPHFSMTLFKKGLRYLFWLGLGSSLGLVGAGWLRPAPEAQLPGVNPLYLMDQASLYLSDPDRFEQRVRDLAHSLELPPEWLMAVMYAESGFDPGIANRKGSGAVGLIQFMPTTAQELSVSTAALQKMDALSQLRYVEAYFDQVRRRYGPYHSLTDLYLGVLFPKARGQSPCYTLYARPSLAYRQNASLDENRDGKVTVHDIDRRLLRLFPEAYVAVKPSENDKVVTG